MPLRVYYFALLRERLGLREELLELPAGTPVRAALASLCARRPLLEPYLAAVRVAVNQEFVDLDHALGPDDELALIPPVAGGSGGYARLSHEAIGLAEVVDAVSGPGQGGVVTFVGNVRGENRGQTVVRLEYEAYEPMALKVMGRLCAELSAARPGLRVAMVHRLGVLGVGETAVVIAAAAPHRAEAFWGCREAIDRLKEQVPIWKKEVTADGATWLSNKP